MTWQTETIDNGAAVVWRGKDSLYNVEADSPERVAKAQLAAIPAGCALAAVIVALLAAGLAGLYGPLVWMVLTFGLVGGYVASGFRLFPRLPEFLGNEWQLRGNPSGFSLQIDRAAKYRQGWAVSVDQVARVETARTSEFTPSRQYGKTVLPVPPHEWQVFLFLNDGTRRVVHLVNAGRDEAAELAASIRAYVESVRSGCAPSSPAPAPSAGAPAGFDL